MVTRILTLPYDPAARRYDDSDLVALQAETTIVGLSLQHAEIHGVALLVCVATCAPSESSPAVPCGGKDARDAGSPTEELAAPGASAEPKLDQAQRALFERIRAWRNEAAQREGVPPYVILTNRQVREIARVRPRSATALQRIHGIGPKKIERHGAEILDLLGRGARTDSSSEAG